MIIGASSSVPVTELMPIRAEDVCTTDGAVRLVDRTTEGVVTTDAGTIEGGSTIEAESKKTTPPVC